MMAYVVDGGQESAAFGVENGVKQGCVFAPLLFGVVISAMMHDAYNDCDKGIAINYRYDGGMFNLRNLKAKMKIRHMLIIELLYADDCALESHTEVNAQVLMDCVARSALRYGLTVSIKKTCDAAAKTQSAVRHTNSHCRI